MGLAEHTKTRLNCDNVTSNYPDIALSQKLIVLNSGELVAPFPKMELKCDQHYYVSTLSDRQWPKIDAFIVWLKALGEQPA